MVSQYLHQPFGKECMFYSTNTNDALADVEAWYKKSLPGATVDDVNKNSPYAPAVLNGIKLLSGKDIINVYRLPKGVHTVIEMFKCRKGCIGGARVHPRFAFGLVFNLAARLRPYW